MWLTPVAYENFYKRLRKGMNLHDAIYYPRVEYQVREYHKHQIQDNIRRVKKLKDENVMVIDFEKMDKILLNKRQHKMAKYNMKPPKKTTLLQRFISLFKK